MKIAIAQINPKVGDIHGNRKAIENRIEGAKKDGARLLLFPELSLVGYPPRDLLDYSCLIEENLKALEEIGKKTKGIAVVCGYVDKNPNATGKPFYNAAAVFDDGKCVGKYYKHLLPYYDVFEEERYFEKGTEGLVFPLEGLRIGVTICEDFWNMTGFIGRPYAEDPLKHYQNQKLDLLVNLSASPFHVGKPEKRLELFRQRGKEVGTAVALCNQVGANDELLFDGNSFYLDKQGKVLGQCQAFAEDFKIVDTKKSDAVLSSSFSAVESHFSALKLGIQDYVRKTGHQKVCLGLSGGIDSSVVAALACEALGSENVEGICLPTRFSSKAGLADAVQLAKNLKMPHRVVPIENLFNPFEKTLQHEFQGKMSSLTLENVQPRIRMLVLMAISNETKSLLLNTSNKSEIATGFATLYGDSSGALGVLGDLTKNEVYALARYINRSSSLIPQSILDRAPSAELKENQVDQDVLPPYEELDLIVKQTIDEAHQPTSNATISAKSVATFSRLHALSEYKRRQLPPVLRVSPRAFGMGRRIPVVSVKSTEL